MGRVNPLARRFPTKIRLDGTEYPLGWRVSDCLPVILAFEDEALTPGEQQEILWRRMFPAAQPPDQERAMLLAVEFLDGGRQDTEADEDDPPQEDWRLYSFARDGGLIYSAFRTQYGIDLQRDELHWWAFLALFHDLDPESRFYQLLHLRQGYLEGTLSREEQQLFDSMGASALPPAQPGDKDREASARHFLDLLEGGGLNGI